MSSASYLNPLLLLICAGTCLGAYLLNSGDSEVSTRNPLPHSTPASNALALKDLVAEAPSTAKSSPKSPPAESNRVIPENLKPAPADPLDPYSQVAAEVASGQTLLPAPTGVEPLSDAHIQYDLERRSELYLAVTYGEDREASPSMENLSDDARHRDGRARIAYDSRNPYAETPKMD